MQKWIALLVVVALAGCTGDSKAAPEPEPEAPAAAPLPAAIELSDSGSLTPGGEDSWTWDLDARAVSYRVEVRATREFYADPITYIDANLYLDGAMVAGTGDTDPTNPGANFSGGTGGTSDVLVYEVKTGLPGKQSAMEDEAGTWRLDMDWADQPGTWTVDVRAYY